LIAFVVSPPSVSAKVPVAPRTVTIWISSTPFPPGRMVLTVASLPPSSVVTTSTRGPGWNASGPTSSVCAGWRLIPKVAFAIRPASGMTLPEVTMLARSPRLAPKSRSSPPAATSLPGSSVTVAPEVWLVATEPCWWRLSELSVLPVREPTRMTSLSILISNVPPGKTLPSPTVRLVTVSLIVPLSVVVVPVKSMT
jgi:hypothetical protein